MTFIFVNTKGLVSTSFDKNGDITIKAKSKDYRIIDWSDMLLSLLKIGITKDRVKIIKTLFLNPSVGG